MGLSSYLTYTVTSLELGDITNDHTQLDWVTRAMYCLRLPGVWILSAFVKHGIRTPLPSTIDIRGT